jgi:hypothetical protein
VQVPADSAILAPRQRTALDNRVTRILREAGLVQEATNPLDPVLPSGIGRHARLDALFKAQTGVDASAAAIDARIAELVTTGELPCGSTLNITGHTDSPNRYACQANATAAVKRVQALCCSRPLTVIVTQPEGKGGLRAGQIRSGDDKITEVGVRICMFASVPCMQAAAWTSAALPLTVMRLAGSLPALVLFANFIHKCHL